MDAHTAEVTRLRNLLRIAQGRDERSRLESELEIMSSNHGLEDMEDAMHKEVRLVFCSYNNKPRNLSLA